MNLLQLYKSLGPTDLKNIRRDPLLAWVVVAPLALALVIRFAVPPLTDLLKQTFDFDLTVYYGLLMSFVVIMAPSMVGMIIGFLLLDEQDDRIFPALWVTPLPFSHYLLYRFTAPLLIGFIITLISYPLAGLAPLPWGDLILASILAAFNGPLTACFLAILSENKVAGFAMVKVLNTINMLPIIAYFVDSQWQIVAGLVPTYWPMKVVWLASAGNDYGLYLVGGLVLNTSILAWMVQYFSKTLHR